eukprot:TRINITY_DN20957_c0_g1_i1.p1 TRINITY_DN20957_c0_g1~~TRINITY_DN20957_c0_g1_i1.p1  ORF type:complete len:280 (+),score=31.56 TRINITY_DN20957_c0_g1_i1:74-841(+)
MAFVDASFPSALTSNPSANFVMRNTFLELDDLVEKPATLECRRRARSLDVRASSESKAWNEASRARKATTGELERASPIDVPDPRELRARKAFPSSRNVAIAITSEVGTLRSRSRPTRSLQLAKASLEQARARILARLDGATTVMLQNLSKNMTQAALAHCVDEILGFRDTYDLLYCPACFDTKKAKGYAFVNLLTPDLAVGFALACEQQNVRVVRADMQGREAYLNRFKCRHSARIRNARHKPIIRNRGTLAMD